MGAAEKPRVQPVCGKFVAGFETGRAAAGGSAQKKKYTPKLYEQMQYPGQRVQIDVKVVPRKCIADPELKLFQYTAIDEYSRYRVLGAYPEQSTYSSADFLRKVVKAFARKGIKVECVQTDNGFEFTNRFSPSKREIKTLFEQTAFDLGIRHKRIRPYTPRHNGKAECSHREDQKRFYGSHRFYSLTDFGGQPAAHQSRSNSRPMRPLLWRFALSNMLANLQLSLAASKFPNTRCLFRCWAAMICACKLADAGGFG